MKFVLLVHRRLLDFTILKFKFMDAFHWTFLSFSICLFLSKLVKASHSPSELRCSALEHTRVQTPSVLNYTDRSKSSEGVGCPTGFPKFYVFISLSVTFRSL